MLQVAVVRHAIAEDRDPGGDATRPLTPEGRAKMRRGAIGLARILRGPTRLVSSPLLRAVQTAELIAQAYGGVTLEQSSVLAPGTCGEDLLEWVSTHTAGTVMILVGHEPILGLWVSACLDRTDPPMFIFKKGAACLLEFPAMPAFGTAVLRWAYTPRQLRELGDSETL
ncbi:MAG: SixA phosphatase family protein [Gammaproteobacteria bacterium]|nr:histidine phosphatase family protein [Gammaproteobacteria bacterium]